MIRTLLPTDAPEIARILGEVHSHATVPIGPKWSSQQILEECLEGGLVDVSATGNVAAFILYRELPDAWEISFLASAIGTMRKGIMMSLFQHLSSLLPSGKSLWLEVHEGNLPARRFYEKAGFKQVGTRPKYYADRGAAILYNYG